MKMAMKRAQMLLPMVVEKLVLHLNLIGGWPRHECNGSCKTGS